MRSPVHALLWEQWRRLRWPMLFAFLLMAAASLLDYTLSKTHNYNPRGMLSLVMLILSMAVFIAFLFFSHSELNDLRPTMPARLYTLPVRTHVLVTCELFSRLAALGLLAFAMLVTHYLLFADKYLDASFLWEMPLLLVVLIALLQAVSWLPAGVLTAAVIGFMLLLRSSGGIFRALIKLAPEPYYTDAPLPALMPALAGLSYLIAFVGVALDRRGAWTGIRRRLATMLRQCAARRDRFASGAHAQLWFEWKRTGRYVPIVGIAFLALSFIVCAYLGPDALRARIAPWLTARTAPWAAVWAEQAALIIGMGLFLCPLIAAFIVGMLTPAMDHRDLVSGFSSFVMTRPMRTRQLAAARFKVGAVSLCLTYALIAAILLAVLGLPACLAGLESAFLSAQSVRLGTSGLTFILVACGHFVLAWALLWLSLPLSGVLLVFYAVSLFVVIPGILPAPTNAGSMWGLSLILLIAMAVLVTLACRRRVLTARDLPAILVLASISAAVLLMLFYWEGEPIFGRDQTGYAETAFHVTLSLIPIAAFLWEPLKLDWFRHR